MFSEPVACAFDSDDDGVVKSADLLGAVPGRKINANSASDRTAINAFYRLIEMPADSAVKVRSILAPHRERSIRRIRGQGKVLAIQDGTSPSFATRPGCEGLEVVGANRTGAKSLGLHLHATLAVTESGLPLGVLRLGFDSTKARPPEAMERRRTRRWLDGFADTAKAVREVSRATRVVAVCDREADCFEMFDAQRRDPRVELLVRARHDRPRCRETLRRSVGDTLDKFKPRECANYIVNAGYAST